MRLGLEESGASSDEWGESLRLLRESSFLERAAGMAKVGLVLGGAGAKVDGYKRAADAGSVLHLSFTGFHISPHHGETLALPVFQRFFRSPFLFGQMLAFLPNFLFAVTARARETVAKLKNQTCRAAGYTLFLRSAFYPEWRATAHPGPPPCPPFPIAASQHPVVAHVNDLR